MGKCDWQNYLSFRSEKLTIFLSENSEKTQVGRSFEQFSPDIDRGGRSKLACSISDY